MLYYRKIISEGKKTSIMTNRDLRGDFAAILGDDAVFVDENMSRHTTFRIGGPADFFLTPHSREETEELLRFLKKQGLPFFIMGNGSNLLVADEGYRGIVISFGRAMSKIEVHDCEIFAEAGTFLSSIAAEALRHSITGFEFAAGIPGSLGGACVMNAGAYGGEMSQVLKSVTASDREGNLHELDAHDLCLGYRHSIFMENNWVVLSAHIHLAPGNAASIQETMNELKGKRLARQPLEYPSAGSTFKRPEGYFAGKLIMDAGLRGYARGDACVSEKHCGFVINKGHATAEDVRALICDVQRIVREKEGVQLEPEVRFLGF